MHDATFPIRARSRPSVEGILEKSKLKADSLHVYENEILDSGEVTPCALHIYPDVACQAANFGKLAEACVK